MQTFLKSKTLSKPINCSVEKVYHYVSDLNNLPKWARAFAKSIQKVGDKWLIQTDQGQVHISMVPKNEYGVLDHYVSPSPKIKIYVPMRVVKNGDICEVIFTLFQEPNMPDNEFSRQLEMVDQDLTSLKKIMES